MKTNGADNTDYCGIRFKMILEDKGKPDVETKCYQRQVVS
jgi:hypothetical protein